MIAAAAPAADPLVETIARAIDPHAFEDDHYFDSVARAHLRQVARARAVDVKAAIAGYLKPGHGVAP